MHILLCTSYPHLPETFGGLQTATDELCLELMDRGLTVTVLCGKVGQGETTASGFVIDSTAGYKTVRAVDPISALPVLTGLLDPDIVVVQTGYALSPMLAAALGTNVPVAVYFHNVELHRVDGVLPDHPSILYLANSDFTARRWNSAFGVQSIVLPPVIREERYAIESTGDRVLFVNPVPEKGLERFLSLAKNNPDIPFVAIEGWSPSDSWRDWLRQRAMGCQNIDWLPSTQDMREVYCQARFLLMPSLWEEAFGRTVIEAQLNGLPVLSSSRGALPQTVGGGGIILDADGDQASWDQALRTLYFDVGSWLKYSEAARHNAEKSLLFGRIALDNALMQLAAHSLRS